MRCEADRDSCRDYDATDFFTDPSLIADPYPYFDHLRAKSPVTVLPHAPVVAVTGRCEGNIVYGDSRTFSSLVAVGGPYPPLPFVPVGDDIGAQIEQYRHRMPMSRHLTTLDPPEHSRIRALLSRLFTPRRMAATAPLIRQLADRHLDGILASGRGEFLADYAKPFTTDVIAELLGISVDERAVFETPRPGPPVGALDQQAVARDRLDWLDATFARYVADRRRQPRADVLTAMAEAPFPDGSRPAVDDVARVATLVFTAARGASAVMLGSSLRVLAEQPELAGRLRAERSLIPAFLEEVLRMESPVKSDFRLARTSTTLGGVAIPAGTTVMVCPGAINRDHRHFANPDEFRLDRANAADHLAFGRGAHYCPGATLARLEARISVERILDRTTSIAPDDEKHGPPGARVFDYEPTYTLRALTELHLEFTRAP